MRLIFATAAMGLTLAAPARGAQPGTPVNLAGVAGIAFSTSQPGYVPVAISSSIPIQVEVGTETLNVVYKTTQPVNVTSLPLPPGAATDVTLQAILAGPLNVSGSTVSIAGLSGSTLPVQFVAPQPVFAASSFPVSADNLDVRALTFARDKVDVSGSTLTVSIALPPVLGVSLQPGTTVLATVAPLAGSTFTVDVLQNGLALDTTVASLFKAGGLVGNTSFYALQAGPYRVDGGTMQVVNSTVGAQQVGAWMASVAPVAGSTWTAAVLHDGVALDSTVAAGFRAGQAIGNTSFYALQSGVYAVSGGTFQVVGTTLPVAQFGPWTATVSPQPGSTWTVVASSLDVRGLSSARDRVTVVQIASVPVVRGDGPWVEVFATTQPVFALAVDSYGVAASSLDVRALNDSRDRSSVSQSSAPWNVTGSTIVEMGSSQAFVSSFPVTDRKSVV